MTTLKEEIIKALSSHGGAKIIDGHQDKAYSYHEILSEIEKLKKDFEGINLHQKVVVFDFYENSIDLVILMLFVIAKGGIPLIIEMSSISPEVTDKLSYFAIVKNKRSILTIEHQMEMSRKETEYGTFFINDNLFNISTYRDCTLLLTSSGTVGDKKIMKFDSPGILNNIHSNIKALGITSKDTTLMCLPIYYSYSLIGQFFSHLFQGANIIIAPYRFVLFSIEHLLNHYKPTNFFTTPTQVNILLGNQIRNNHFSLRFITIGGGYLNKFSFQRFTKLYPSEIYFKTYGITEAGPRVTTYTVDHQQAQYFEPNYLGVPLDIVGLSLSEKVGQYHSFDTNYLRITSPSIFKGYLLSDVQNTLQTDCLITEDIVYQKDDKVYILGRKTDKFDMDHNSFWRFEIEDTICEKLTGILKIKLTKTEKDLNIGIMKHPGSRLSFDDVRDTLKHRFGSKFLTNTFIGKYNERFAFTK